MDLYSMFISTGICVCFFILLSLFCLIYLVNLHRYYSKKIDKLENDIIKLKNK